MRALYAIQTQPRALFVAVSPCKFVLCWLLVVALHATNGIFLFATAQLLWYLTALNPWYYVQAFSTVSQAAYKAASVACYALLGLHGYSMGLAAYRSSLCALV